jgi:hypothetical protein
VLLLTVCLCVRLAGFLLSAVVPRRCPHATPCRSSSSRRRPRGAAPSSTCVVWCRPLAAGSVAFAAAAFQESSSSRGAICSYTCSRAAPPVAVLVDFCLFGVTAGQNVCSWELLRGHNYTTQFLLLHSLALGFFLC